MLNYLLMRNGPYELVIAPPDYPGKKYRGRYCYEHHLVWWRRTGEILAPGWLLHHLDENKRNNAFDNLEKKTIPAHTAEHSRDRAPDPIRITCGTCSKAFEIPPNKYRTRMKTSKSGKLFCSHSCGASYQFLFQGG